jgi:hypothetical protein
MAKAQPLPARVPPSIRLASRSEVLVMARRGIDGMIPRDSAVSRFLAIRCGLPFSSGVSVCT